MNRMKTIFIAIVAFALMGLPAMAKASTQRPYRLSEQQVRNLLQRLESHSDRFRSSVDQALDRSRIDGSKAEDNINQLMQDFHEATDRLKDRFDDNQTAATNVEAVLRRSVAIDNFLWRHPMTPRVQQDWQQVRRDLQEMAQAYHVEWGWLGPIGVPHRVSETRMNALVAEIETKSDRFRKSLDNALDQTHFDGTNAEDNINQFVKDFEVATDRLKDRFDNDNTATMTVLEILRRAARIDTFMRRHPLRPAAQTDWRSLRGSLDQLAVAYHTSWRWM
jgi:cytochrome c556